jgi:hypothetical protein
VNSFSSLGYSSRSFVVQDRLASVFLANIFNFMSFVMLAEERAVGGKDSVNINTSLGDCVVMPDIKPVLGVRDVYE